MTICKRVVYAGTVQGVGFRYTTRALAQNFAVTGFVRNLPDGNVELVAEGEQAEVQRFLDALDRKMARYIQERRVMEDAPSGFVDFMIER
jgi:acylphosphatase